MTPATVTEDRDRIDEQASYWVTLASERELNAEEQRDRDAWRAADPRHERTWQDLTRTWSDIAALGHLGDIAPPLPQQPEAKHEMARSLAARSRHLRLAASAAIAAVLLAAIALTVMIRQNSPQRYETRLAETRIIALPDGSQVTLAPASSLEVRFAEGQRLVALTKGEAFFEVVHDAQRPFTVQAGRSTVRVLGTKFDVNYTEQSVRVSVLQGKVEVSDAAGRGSGPRSTQLIAGQRTELRFTPPALSASPMSSADNLGLAATTLPASSPGSWREGRLVYDNVRLADLISDVNRYYAPGVSIIDPAIGEYRITAAFKVSEIQAFVAALDGVIPVATEEQSDGSFDIRRGAGR